MPVNGRIRTYGLHAALLAFVALGASTPTGRQDIPGLLAHQSGIAERARLSIYSGAVHTLKAATFAWPSHSPLTAITRANDGVNRLAKTDRLAMAPAAELAVPEVEAGAPTPEGITGSGTATTLTGLAGESTSIGAAGTGIGTDPYESDDALTEAEGAGPPSDSGALLSAGDPTGDPAQLEAAMPAEDIDTSDGYEIMGTGDVMDGGTVDDHVAGLAPIYRDRLFIFGSSRDTLPPQPFLHREAHQAADGGSSLAAKSDDVSAQADAALRGPNPAERLGLDGKRRARAEKCLAEAVYFESRGEPERGQVAVAQVVMNRVFSGYYPADVCRAVYQNAHRRLACQFTFACDNIRDVVTEPRLWSQAQHIAAAVLDGEIWDEKVGRATHYHARSVRPNWIGEMRKLDRIGEHTFYRPRRWTS